MAGALRTSLSLHPSFTSISRKNLSPKCSLPSSQPRKLTKRKNHLRTKILKTLTKPHPNLPIQIPIDSPSTIPVIPVESPPEQIPTFPSDEVSGEEPKEAEMQEVEVDEVEKHRIVNHGKSFALNFLLWLVASFVLQRIYVWVFGSYVFDGKNGKFIRRSDKDEILEIGVHGNSKSKLKILFNGYKNGGIALVDEAEVERKIEEIRVMASEARAKEKMEAAKSGGSDYSDDDDDSFAGNAIGKEIENRLLRLHKPLIKASEKLPASSVDRPKINGERKKGARTGGFDEKKMNDAALMFDKKHKFRDFPGEPSHKPNGFAGPLVPNGEEQGQQKRAQTSGRDKGNVSFGVGKNSLKEREKNSGERRDVAKSGNRTGVAQDGSNQNMLVEAPNNNEPSTSETIVISNEESRPNRNLSSNKEKITERKLAKKSGSTSSEKDTNFWWLNLPYILVVFMRIGDDDEGTQGPFSIKSNSDDLSHIVAFEDHGDAINFCYILDSYFEDLEDFSTEIVPLSNNEHDESVKSNAENFIVVRKGQLKLYAGQPLSDVEMALRSLAAQS